METFSKGRLTLLPPREGEIHIAEKKGGYSVLRVETKPFEYYVVTPLRFQINGELPAPVFYVELTFYDDFFAQIMTNGKDKAGITGLGTNRVRHAVFEYDTAVLNADWDKIITIGACESLIDIQITTDPSCIDRAKAERARKDELFPVNPLKRDMLLVTTCNIITLQDQNMTEIYNYMDDFCPLMRRIGVKAFECYVQWRRIEVEPGVFDFAYYDEMVEKAAEFGLMWFPLIVVGSAYALPEWFHDGIGFTGFKCLEHGISNEIPTVFNRDLDGYVSTFMRKFGEHYIPTGRLAGVRLGPSGNYGESQYPAGGGNCGYKRIPQHNHKGWWAGDECASPAFRAWLIKKYGGINELNTAWNRNFGSFDEIETFLPVQATSFRMRKDFVDWYNFEMTDWCEKWAVWAREGMPGIPIYQSVGGWGHEQTGTDFTAQSRSMRLIGNGGVRSTNENEDYLLNNNITRVMSSAARFYGVMYGSEPAGYSCTRGIASRFYNNLIRCGEHLFYYHNNLIYFNGSVRKYMELLPLLDERDTPFVEVAAYYPQTRARLDDSVTRYIQGSAFYSRTSALRPFLDFDFCSDMMIEDGALETYKVLMFMTRWHEGGDVAEQSVLEKIDEWVTRGGTVIYPQFQWKLANVEGGDEIYKKWLAGDTGAGQVVFFRDDAEPTSRYARYLSGKLKTFDFLDGRTKRMINLEKPEWVFAACYENGRMVLFNYNEENSCVVDGGCRYELTPYEVKIV